MIKFEYISESRFANFIFEQQAEIAESVYL
jgi:hypothetical protein